MDKIIFPDWFEKLPPQVQHLLQYGEQRPYTYIQYIDHLSPDEIREAITNPDLKGILVQADLSNVEEVEQQVRNLLSFVAWSRDTSVKSQLPEELNYYKFIRHYGNKAVVMHWTHDQKMIHQSLAEFKNSHIDRFIMSANHKTGQWERLPLANVWLTDTRTPRYDYAEFLPGVEREDVPEGILNLWQGWPCRSDITDDSLDEPSYCELFLKHMYDNLCGGDDDVYFYLLGWMADALINPHRTSEVAIVLRGAQGSGKTFWAKFFMELFAPHTLTLDKPNQVTGGFNKHLQDKSVIFADEAFFAGNHQHAATLKTLITSDEIFIEPKGVDGFMAKKLFRVIIASNDEHVIRAEIDDRRYLVLDVDAGKHNQDGDYFGAIAKEWSSGGRDDLFAWLRGSSWKETLELGVWDVRARPKTAALQKQKDFSLPPTQAIIHQMLHDGELPELYDVIADTGHVFIATRLLAERHRLSPKDETALGASIRALTDANAESARVYLDEGYNRKQYRGFWLPTLDVCRKRWEAHLQREIEWPDDVKSWAVEGTKKEEPPF
ncbi:MAG: hypothetical protein KUG81_09340 [Gammaproteobacteria bacterium]|nr:hypothetical protein [Gammaproteobacteria bacterium]